MKKTIILVIVALLIGIVGTYIFLNGGLGFNPLADPILSNELTFSTPTDVATVYSDLKSLDCEVYRGELSESTQVDSYNAFLSLVRGKSVLIRPKVEWYYGYDPVKDVTVNYSPVLKPFSDSCPSDLKSLYGEFGFDFRGYDSVIISVDGNPLKEEFLDTRNYLSGNHTMTISAKDGQDKVVLKTFTCYFAPTQTSDFYIIGENSYATSEYFKTIAFTRESVWIYGVQDKIFWYRQFEGQVVEVKFGTEQTIRDLAKIP